jgi:superfamily II DNA or RNA helicase
MLCQVLVDNRVRMQRSGLHESVLDMLREEFTHKHLEEEGLVYYRTFEETDEEISFPRGGMSRVRSILRASNIEFKVKDERCLGDFELLDDGWGGQFDIRRIPDHKVQLWDFQERVVEAILKKHNCLVEAHTGVGKTTAALAAIARIGMPALVVVNAGGLREQWVKRVSKELGVAEDRVGIIGDGERHTAPITIGMQQTIKNGIDPEWLKAFGIFVADEVDLYAAPTFMASVDPWPAAYRFGMTSTVKRHDKMEFMVYDLFGEVVEHVTQEEAIQKKRIVDVEIRVVPTEFEAPWYKAAVMSGNKFRLRAAHQKLLKALWTDEGRNRLAQEIIRQEVARGEQVMVLSLRREHCFKIDRELTAQGIKSGVMLGGAEAKKEFKRTHEGVQDGTVRVVVGTTAAIGRGQDFPRISVGVVTMPIANNKQLMGQVRGRFCRACEEIGKEGGTLFYLADFAVHGKKVLQSLMSENEKVSVREKDGTWVSARQYLQDNFRESSLRSGRS